MSDGFLYQGVNMPKLIALLRGATITPDFIPKNYFNGSVRIDTPILGRDENGKDKKLNVSAGLANTVGKIDLNIARCKFEYEEKQGIYTLIIPYQTSIDKSVRYAIKIYSHELEGFLQVTDLIFSGSRERVFRDLFDSAIKKLGSSTNTSFISEWYGKISPWISVGIPYSRRIEHLDRILNGIVSQYGFADREKAVLNLLTSFTPRYNNEPAVPSIKQLPNTQATLILNELLKTGPATKKNIFHAIYDKLNDFGGSDNFTKGMLLLYELWNSSDFKLPSNPLYQGYPSPTNLPYNSEKNLAFISPI